MVFTYFPRVALQVAGAAFGLAASSLAWSQAGAVHQHGVGQLELALAGNVLELQIRSPGMDLLGFEHEPRTDADREAIETLRRTLLESTRLIELDPAAACTRVAAEVEAHDAGAAAHADHDDHDRDHDDDHDDDHDHDGDHGHDHGQKPAGHKHDGHDHKHDAHSHKHDGHGHSHGGHSASSGHSHDHDHADAHGHSDWSVHYRYECQFPEKLRAVGLGWFEAFPNAEELRFQAVTPAGQTGGSLKPGAASIRW